MPRIVPPKGGSFDPGYSGAGQGGQIDPDGQLSGQINDSHPIYRKQNPAYGFVAFLIFRMVADQ